MNISELKPRMISKSLLLLTVKLNLRNGGVFDPIFKLKTLLRRCEYHKNNKSNIYHFLMFVILRYRFRRLQRKMCSEIGFNVFGKGLIIWHGQRIITNGEARGG